MSPKKELYGEDYLAIHNKLLEAHPKYREAMKFTQLLPYGDVVFNTKDKVLSKEDKDVLMEITTSVSEKYKYSSLS